MDRDETVLLFGQNIATTENDPFLKAGYGFTAGWAGQHTGSIYGMFMGVPGLKIALPATAADAKGLMASAIRDNNPVVFFHHYLLTLTPGEVPEGEYLVPFGRADIKRPGTDVTTAATRPSRQVRPGDTVVVGPGERHWHGAAPDHLMCHMAIQDRDPAVWHEHVTDEDYRAAPGSP
jgi:pyruvate/2-oxoglutarate/acetoin dehydrogenase E1 component